MAVFETFKIFIIPLINHQNLPLNKIFASSSTLRIRFLYILIKDRNSTSFFHLEKISTSFTPKTKPSLLICFDAHPSSAPQQDFCQLHFAW